VSRHPVLALASIATLAAAAPAFAQCTTPKSNTSTTRTCSISTTTNGATGAWIVNKLGTMTLSSNADIALTTPTTASYDSHMDVEPSTGAVVRTVTITANAAWALTGAPNTVSSPSYWTATNDGVYGGFVAARANKPSSDLFAGIAYDASGTGYLAFPTSNTGSTTLATGAATASQVVTLYWASFWIYELDKPGSYRLPIQVVLTLP